MTKELKIGSILIGFCEGHFGKDSSQNKQIEAMGPDWVVCRDIDGYVHFATADDTWAISELRKFLELE